MTEQRPPRVFISYSHDTIKHQERVLDLADRLRADGIDAEVDQYNAAPTEGWPLWCERQIDTADIVLMICTETYHRLVKGDEQQGKNLGVVWEARIIRQLLYDSSAVSDKFVPVLFSDGSPEQIPRPIKGWTWYIIDTENGYEGLYRRLTKQPRVLRPLRGAIRPLPPRRPQWPQGSMEATSPSLNHTVSTKEINKPTQKIGMVPTEGSKKWSAKIVFTEGYHTIIRLKTDVAHTLEYVVTYYSIFYRTAKVFLDGNVVSSGWRPHKFIIPDDGSMYDATMITREVGSKVQITLVVAGQVLLQEPTANP